MLPLAGTEAHYAFIEVHFAFYILYSPFKYPVLVVGIQKVARPWVCEEEFMLISEISFLLTIGKLFPRRKDKEKDLIFSTIVKTTVKYE